MQARQLLIGLAASIFVAVLCLIGAFDAAERATIDWRARSFDFFSPPPSPDILIAGIDDRAIREVQAWPWDRAYLASAVRELTRADASVIALDILIEEPRSPELLPGDDPLAPRFPARSADHDLAGAIAAHGRVVAPIRFASSPSTNSAPDRGDAEPPTQASLPGASQRRRADESARVLAHHILSSSAPCDLTTHIGVFVPGPPALPLWSVGGSAARLGDVSLHAPDPDGVVRSFAPVVLATVPVHQSAPRLWPNFAVAAALLHRGQPTLPDWNGRGYPVTFPGDLPPCAIPTTPLTWPRGGSSFAGQFTPDPATPQEISLAAVLRPALIERGVRSNLLAIAQIIEQAPILGLESSTHALSLSLALAGATDVLARPGYDTDVAALRTLCTPLSESAREFLEFVEQDAAPPRPTNPSPASDDDPETAARLAYLKSAATTLPELLDACQKAPAHAAASREQLRALIAGKLVFVGYTATGAAADTVHTSIHPRTPGVYVHAAVANSMLTGFLRHPAPRFVSLALSLLLGVLGTLVAVRFPLWASPIALALLLVAWFVLCGVGVWDLAQTIVSCTSPLFTAGAGWLAATLHRALIEQRIRRRTEEQFRAYVSPEVVDVLVESPHLRTLTPQRRDLTVLMADLEGFTSLAERLGEERTGLLLNRYLTEMTAILLDHGATIDKYLGDGIMAFWGAPISIDPIQQARSACAAASAMKHRLAHLNTIGEWADAGHLHLRVGIACGPLMVGDFGSPPTRSSYTVIGDPANLASRLEEACKPLGVGVLVSRLVKDRASEASADTSAFAPAGTLHLRGRAEPEHAWILLHSPLPVVKDTQVISTLPLA